MKLKLYWQILIAFASSIIFGLFFSEYVKYVSWIGDLFLRALKMIIIPLVFSSIISGVTNIGSSRNLGRIGIKTIIYYVVTSILAILTGLLFVNFLKPGVGADLGFTKEVGGLAAATESFGITLLHIIPVNIFHSLTEMNMLQIIFFAIIFGFFITQTDSKYQIPLKTFFNAVFEVVMKITMFVIKFVPFGIFGIVAGIIAEQAGDPSALLDIAGRLSLYMLTVISALFIHFSFTLPLIVKTIGRVDPLKHLKVMTTPLLTAFSTASSNATLPLTMEAVEKRAGVSNKITSFVLPLGATVNMDGTALYECVAAIFIAQAYGIELSFIQHLIVVITALLASIGAAGIPMAGLVMISIVITAVGLPLEGVGLILAVDRFLDMFRTMVNVWSDSCGAVVIAKTEGEILNVE